MLETNNARQHITLLGSTGSIGQNTLAVIDLHREIYQVFALTANTNVEQLFDQCCRFQPRYAVVSTKELHVQLIQKLTEYNHLNKQAINTEILWGKESLEKVACNEQVDTVVAAIVGSAGLASTYAAVCAGKKILLANKESLVMSGAIMTQAAARSGATILPIDSEHNAIFQCFPHSLQESLQSYNNNVTPSHYLDNYGISKILLTGSGGPFRQREVNTLSEVTPQEACAHPNWSMGQKISVDSATMMNKGLELIEACWLFNLSVEQIQIVIHPQSIIHSMVQYSDGSVLAQLGNPDMRTPIAHCLAWPSRINAGVKPLDFFDIAQLEFIPPDMLRFPCLKMAIDAMKRGSSHCIALNASNEIAVEEFLQGNIGFTDIPKMIAFVLESWSQPEPVTLDDVQTLDGLARSQASGWHKR